MARVFKGPAARGARTGTPAARVPPAAHSMIHVDKGVFREQHARIIELQVNTLMKRSTTAYLSPCHYLCSSHGKRTRISEIQRNLACLRTRCCKEVRRMGGIAKAFGALVKSAQAGGDMRKEKSANASVGPARRSHHCS